VSIAWCGTGGSVRRFVVIEGLIGVGKTTLCRLLQERRDAELVLEPHEDNPFLEPFYLEPKRYALPVQMYFLLTRWRQLDRIRQLSLFNPWVVSDYLYEKDRIFAEKTLHGEELELYGRFASQLGKEIPTPDLVVALRAPLPVLMERINRRGIAGEDRITQAYLEDLAGRYDDLWSNWSACPVLHIDNSELQYHSDPAAKADVLARIDAALDGESQASTPGSSDREAQPNLFGVRR
jgi:deoxyadenosine/deoxycytidine kinase